MLMVSPWASHRQSQPDNSHSPRLCVPSNHLDSHTSLSRFHVQAELVTFHRMDSYSDSFFPSLFTFWLFGKNRRVRIDFDRNLFNTFETEVQFPLHFRPRSPKNQWNIVNDSSTGSTGAMVASMAQAPIVTPLKLDRVF